VRLGHLGGWAPHKGIHLLRAALMAERFERLDLTVVDHHRNAGEVDEQIWGTVPVHVIGKVPQTEMATMYDRLDVLLAPSIWPESYGLITREALACGLWVVTGGLGGIGDDVVDGRNGFIIETETPGGLIGALRKIDADPVRYQHPPDTSIAPRLSFTQADELAVVYRRIGDARTPGQTAHALPAVSDATSLARGERLERSGSRLR
jgi:glycosyltransferase involved in cell wall biosynthesis